jgi:hypothetical protein
LEFLRFFDLYPKQRDLLTVAVDQGIFTTIKALLGSPLLFWSIAVMLPLHLMYLSCAALALCSRAILDRAGVAALFTAGYYMAIAGGPGDCPPSRNAHHLHFYRIWPLRGVRLADISNPVGHETFRFLATTLLWA